MKNLEHKDTVEIRNLDDMATKEGGLTSKKGRIVRNDEWYGDFNYKGE